LLILKSNTSNSFS